MFALLTGALMLTGSGVVGQDPARGWMAYAVGSLPSKYERITSIEMTWKVNSEPGEAGSNAFYSPWFGMDPADNLNLLQPVNPWLGRGWEMYTEYFQWKPVHNSNSRQHPVQAGQALHGAITYDKTSDSYEITQTVVETGAKSSQIVKCQNGKKFTVPYVVYEKTFPCKSYSPDGKVTFDVVKLECDGSDCMNEIKWEAKVKDANCNMQAHIESPKQISITWDTTTPSKYDNFTQAELVALNAHGWAARFAARSDVIV